MLVDLFVNSHFYRTIKVNSRFSEDIVFNIYNPLNPRGREGSFNTHYENAPVHDSVNTVRFIFVDFFGYDSNAYRYELNNPDIIITKRGLDFKQHIETKEDRMYEPINIETRFEILDL